MLFCFTMKKYDFKPKLLLWTQVPFWQISLTKTTYRCFLMLAKKVEHKGKKSEDLLKLANIWSITKPLLGVLGAEAPTQRCSLKSVFKSCAKFTGESICWSLLFNKVAGMSTAALLKRDSVASVFLWIVRNF